MNRYHYVVEIIALRSAYNVYFVAFFLHTSKLLRATVLEFTTVKPWFMTHSMRLYFDSLALLKKFIKPSNELRFALMVRGKNERRRKGSIFEKLSVTRIHTSFALHAFFFIFGRPARVHHHYCRRRRCHRCNQFGIYFSRMGSHAILSNSA